MTILLFLLIAFLLISGFCAASETAFFSLSKNQLKGYRASKIPSEKRVGMLLEHPRELMSTILIVNVFVNLMVQNVASNILGDYSGWLLNVGVPLGLTLVFGDLIPKSLGIASNERISKSVSLIFIGIKKVLWPMQRALTRLAAIISRLLFFYLRKEAKVSVDELRHAFDDIRESGLVQREEAEIVSGYLRFQSARAVDLMRSRDEVLFYDTNDDLARVAYLIKDRECSRLPVCTGGIDHIQGVMTSRIYSQNPGCLDSKEALLKASRKPFFVPELTPAKTLLRQFQKLQESFAIVVDEQGGVSGIITLEDLVEEIIGEIDDKREPGAPYTLYEGGVLICHGRMELSTIEELLHVKFESKYRPTTIGGYLTELGGDIPKTGTSLEDDQLVYYVLSSAPNRVKRVHMRLKKRREGS